MNGSARGIEDKDAKETEPVADCAVLDLTKLRQIIERAGLLLPQQGPITAFAFLNTLQALEHLPFHQGMKQGAALYGCRPYMPEDYYRTKLLHSRKRVEDLSTVLLEDLGDSADMLIGFLGTRYHLRLAMLQHPMGMAEPTELEWLIAETDALQKFRSDAPGLSRERTIEETHHWVMRDLRNGSSAQGFPTKSDDPEGDRDIREIVHRLFEAFGKSQLESWNADTWEAYTLHLLWQVCQRGVGRVMENRIPTQRWNRHRDALLEATGADSDRLVHEVLIRFTASFVDQGFAGWTLPQREQGFSRAFMAYYGQSKGPPDRWLRGLRAEIARLQIAGMGPLESIAESLQMMGVDETEAETFLSATLLALRGWAGMLWQLESRPDRVPRSVAHGTLIEFLAIRLMLERIALTHLATSEMRLEQPLRKLRHIVPPQHATDEHMTIDQAAFIVFQLAQVRGWLPRSLHSMPQSDWESLVAEITAFSGLERRRILHVTFERRFRKHALDALAARVRRAPIEVARARFQATFCLDAREESFRRHLEEVAPDVETFGIAGFYGVPMYYRGAADAHFAALCPIVIKPTRWVVEDVVYNLEGTHRRRAVARRALGNASHRVHAGSRNFAIGAILATGGGALATIPLVARILFPRFAAQLRKTAGSFVEAPNVSRLRLERLDATPSSEGDGIGFSLEEMAEMGERALRDIGLTSNFARLVFILGHGATCLNNPHKSCYDCGACSGSAGGPNARALAMILNDARVRAILSKNGLEIPAETYFIGGMHNTCTDSITFFDLDLMQRVFLHDFEAARTTLEEACRRNAHERCRRFELAPLDLSLEGALRHVEERSEDLAQTRPEYGNSTNALCIVGRRSRIRGLYLDRRPFLMSYDPTQDDEEATILGLILGAVVPVCSGINLQYTLSYIDNVGWGSGTKLPHNITSLLGVMDGASSDLRPGLPWQGLDIHDPMRLLFVLETTEQAIRKIMDRNETVRNILLNEWAQLALLDPQSGEIKVYRDDRFLPYRPESLILPHASSSLDWYRGWREHLDFAYIGDGASRAEPT
jgi:uncharacterized protein YbcC (UPF0753/DUF2309 family)